MYYVCLENNSIVSILNYSPNVPSSVIVHEITDAQANQIKEQTHYFDVTSKTVLPVSAAITAQKAQEISNGLEREFLNSTDWKILRHLRQKTLNIATTLTEAEYLKLEQERNEAAARIV